LGGHDVLILFRGTVVTTNMIKLREKLDELWFRLLANISQD
jgi:hypothetical protein